MNIPSFFSSGRVLRVAALSVLFSGSFTACSEKDLLEPAPLINLNDLQAFATPDRVLGLVNGLYSSVKSGQFLGGRYLVYIDVRGEEFLNVSNNGVTALDTWRHNNNAASNEPTNLWSAGYLAINRANLFMEGLKANATVVSADLATQYNAEALFVRALAYFQMVQLYAQPFTKNAGTSPGLPLRLKGEVGNGNNDLKRSTVAEVYTQILADLNAAEQGLPLTYASAALNTTRAHKNTAIALKTRVYLTMGRYADVVTEANKIVPTAAPFRAATGVAHQLQADVKTVFSNYTTVESIFSFPMSDNDVPGTQNGLASYYMPGPTGIGDYSLNATAASIVSNAAFSATDARRAFIQTFAGDASRVRLTKFPTGPVHKDFVPSIRYSEVLLNLAEAITRSTNAVDPRALALLNAVRTRSGATAYTAADFATSTALADGLLLERRIELLGEGFRSNDLLRLGLPLPAKSNISAIPNSANNYIWPIPQSELNVNKAAEPNP